MVITLAGVNRQKFKYRFPTLRIPVRRQTSSRFVEPPNLGRLGFGDRLPIDHDDSPRGHVECRTVERFAVDCNPTGFNPSLGLPA